MRIILTGMKGCGKTTVGKLLAAELQIPFIDSDTEIEKACKQDKGEAISFRQIFEKYGEKYFQALDMQALQNIASEYSHADFVFACGGRTSLQKENQEVLRELGQIIFLNIEKSVLLKRILAQGVPAFFPYQDDPARSLDELLERRLPIYRQLADRTLDVAEEAPGVVVATILAEVRGYGED